MTQSSRLRPLSIAAGLTCAALAIPASADPTFGFGLTMTFGGGQPDVGVGLRVFSDDKRDEFVGAIGVDYMFRSESWRGTVGAAYLKENAYIGLDLGFDLQGGGMDFGIGVGGVKTADPAPAAPAGGGTPPPPEAS